MILPRTYRHWLHSLITAFISGGASAVTAAVTANLIKPEAFNLGTQMRATLELMAASFLINGVLNALNFLRQSPLPPETEDTTTNNTPDMKKLSSILLTTGLLASTFVFQGMSCRSPSKAHVIRGVGSGTKVGITQNPATQVYELGLAHIQAELITVPIVFPTNKDGTVYVVVPDVVDRVEVGAKSGVFGHGASTWTLAVGTNGVQTAVGGTTPPINAGFSTNNPPLLVVPK